MDDFYDLFGVGPDADEADLKRAYRNLARRYHPDVNDDPRAHAQFKTIRRGYEVLTDPKERRRYDDMGHARYVAERMDGLPTMGPASEQGRRWSAAGAEPDDGGLSESGTPSDGSGRDAAADDRFDPDEFDAEAFDRRYGSRSLVPPVTPLLLGWLAVLVAAVTYVAGLTQYLTANATGLAAFADALVRSPGSALSGEFAVTLPLAFLQSSLSVPGPALLFPVGVVALPVVFAAVVVKFGSGSAYAYLLGAFAPLAAVAAGSALAGATALGVVVGLVVLPLAGTLLFLGDVGRYLAATR
jgi:hypothetical protein